MEAFIKQCPHCEQFATPPKEPMMSSPLPSHPWKKVGADLFEFDKTSYLIDVDYFSQFPEVIKLTGTTPRSIITALKSIFLIMACQQSYLVTMDHSFPLLKWKSFQSCIPLIMLPAAPIIRKVMG